jgi:phage gp46-like protein
MSEQLGDVLLYQTVDDGNIILENGIVTMNGGLESAAYISIFGGNEDDDGRQNNPAEWWGNKIGQDPNERLVSRTQYLLDRLPATSSNLLKIQDAAEQDLAWMVELGVATSIVVEASIPSLNRVMLTCAINNEGEATVVQFTENWKASI